MNFRRFAAVLALLCLAAFPALAASPDLGTLRYTPPQSPAADLSETAQAENRVIPLDLWMDATPNMGGVNLVEDTLYPTGSSAQYYRGGFHYQWQDKYREFHGWYVDLLTALPELLGPQRSQVRVLRYDDGLFSDELLEKHGLMASSAEAATSLQRDLRTWATQATGETFTEMVQPGPENFYAPGVASAARADQVELENPALSQALLAAQQEGLALQQAGDASALVSREEGGSHLLTALRYLDPTHLNLITLDTWSLGSLDAVVDGKLTDPYAAVLAERGLFDGGDTAMTVFALRMDYVGALTSFAWETPAEALQWGRLSRGNSGIWRECAMPRCMLLLLLGPASEVEETAQRLETLFAGEVFAQVRGFQDGDGPVTVVNYFYEDEKIMRSTCTFAYVREDFPRVEAQPVQTLESATAMTHNGQAADLTQTVTLRPENGRYADQTFTWRFPISQDLGLDGDALARGASLSLAGSLTLQQTLPNTPQEREALESAGIQYTLYRDTLYAFAPLASLEGATVTAAVENGEAVLTLRLDGEALTPGWRTFRLSLNIPADAWEAPAGLRWLADNGPQGNADAGKWDYDYGERVPQRWLELPQALHDAGAQTRSRLADSLRHAWCDGNAALTLDRVPNIPPVFRLLEAGELLDRLRQGALRVETPLARLDITVFCDTDTMGEVSP